MRTNSIPRPLPLFAAAILLLSGGCTPPAPTASPGPRPGVVLPMTIDQVYAQAMSNAALYSPENVLPLFPAVPDSNGNVTVVTLTTWQYQQGPQQLDREVWVSVVPEVRDSCTGWDDPDLVMRLRQLIGLRPTDSVSVFAEMTVPASSMFRPTVDPSITTRHPCPVVKAADPTCGLNFPPGVDTTHITWMANQMLSSWTVPDGYPSRTGGGAQAGPLGYPWTRLGYTYNWHPGSPRYGASEYLVRGGAQITVDSVYTIDAYCGRNGGNGSA